MKKLFFVLTFFVLGPTVVLAQQIDLRKDDQRFFKGQPSPALGDPTTPTQQKKTAKRLSKAVRTVWRLAQV